MWLAYARSVLMEGHEVQSTDTGLVIDQCWVCFVYGCLGCPWREWWSKIEGTDLASKLG